MDDLAERYWLLFWMTSAADETWVQVVVWFAATGVVFALVGPAARWARGEKRRRKREHHGQ